MARKESFIGRDSAVVKDPNMITAMVTRKVNKKGKNKGTLNALTRDEKMLCALRKALAAKSGLTETLGARYYIAGNEVYVTSRTGGTHMAGTPGSYKASGRFRLGSCAGDRAAFRVAQFSITYTDVIDERGIPDVDFVDPTTIDLLPKSTSLVPS